MINNNHSHFNFLEEIWKNDTYHQLLPNPKSQLAIIGLYAKVKNGIFRDGKFREKDIHTALEEAYRQTGNVTYERIPQESFNTAIGDLQTYFLRYDEDEQVYTFKEYAESLCRLLENTLKEAFNPTQIELICSDLRNKLDICQHPEDINNWVSLHFDAFKPKLKSQVDHLDRKIDTTVNEIRQTAQLHDGSALEILKQIDTKLDQIRVHNKELRSAFREMKYINSLLDKHLMSIEDNNIFTKLNDARQFFPGIRYRLDLVDKRLDRIQPKLQQFFGTLNKPLFNVKVEKFLRFLLDTSTVNKKALQLPTEILTPQIFMPVPKFTIVERRADLFPAIPRKRNTYQQTPETRHEIFGQLNQKVIQQDHIDKWIKEILERSKVEGSIRFSSFFFSIVDQSNGNIELAARVAHRLLKLSAHSNSLTINVDNRLLAENDTNNIAIWEMTIQLR